MTKSEKLYIRLSTKFWVHNTFSTLNRQDLINHVRIEYKKYLRRHPGQAASDGSHIQFSSFLWYVFPDKIRREIAIHEACHIVDLLTLNKPIDDHGERWKSLMEKCNCIARKDIPLVECGVKSLLELENKAKRLRKQSKKLRKANKV